MALLVTLHKLAGAILLAVSVYHLFWVFTGLKQGRVQLAMIPGLKDVTDLIGNVQYFVVDADRYIYQDRDSSIWMTHIPREILSRLDPVSGTIPVHKTPRTEGMSEKGVHLYAAVADSHDRLWYTETHGNRLGMLDPATGATFEVDMADRSAWRSIRTTCCGYRNWPPARSPSTTPARAALSTALRCRSRATSPMASAAIATPATCG